MTYIPKVTNLEMQIIWIYKWGKEYGENSYKFYHWNEIRIQKLKEFKTLKDNTLL